MQICTDMCTVHSVHKYLRFMFKCIIFHGFIIPSRIDLVQPSPPVSHIPEKVTTLLFSPASISQSEKNANLITPGRYSALLGRRPRPIFRCRYPYYVNTGGWCVAGSEQADASVTGDCRTRNAITPAFLPASLRVTALLYGRRVIPQVARGAGARKPNNT